MSRPDASASLAARRRTQAILDGYDPQLGRSVAFAIQFLIVLSVVSIAISTLPDLPDWVHDILIVEEWVIVAIFAAEYVLRVWAAEKRLRYIFSFYGIVDFLSVAPTLLMMGWDVRSVRAFRAFRVLRLFKLMRYVRAFERLGRALTRVAEELIVFAGIALIVLYLCASAIYHFEHDAQPETFSSIPHSMWWAIVTLTTVGYGDVVPVTTGGRIFTGVVLILALGIIAVPTGLLATALSDQVHEDHRHGEGGGDGEGGGHRDGDGKPQGDG